MLTLPQPIKARLAKEAAGSVFSEGLAKTKVHEPQRDPLARILDYGARWSRHCREDVFSVAGRTDGVHLRDRVLATH